MHRALPLDKEQGLHASQHKYWMLLDDSDDDEVDFLQEYDSSDVDLDLDSDKSSDDDGSTIRPIGTGRGHVPQRDGGDNIPDNGWTTTFVSPTMDLNHSKVQYWR